MYRFVSCRCHAPCYGLLSVCKLLRAFCKFVIANFITRELASKSDWACYLVCVGDGTDFFM